MILILFKSLTSGGTAELRNTQIQDRSIPANKITRFLANDYFLARIATKDLSLKPSALTAKR